MMLHRMQERGERVVVKLQMEAHMLPDADSRNVMAEITGSERPEQVVVMGGHIDSWDVGQGAMDDGGGVVAAWEAVRSASNGWASSLVALFGSSAGPTRRMASVAGSPIATRSAIRSPTTCSP